MAQQPSQKATAARARKKVKKNVTGGLPPIPPSLNNPDPPNTDPPRRLLKPRANLP